VEPKLMQVAAATTPESLNTRAATAPTTTPPIPLRAWGWFFLSQAMNLDGQMKLAASTAKVASRVLLQML